MSNCIVSLYTYIEPITQLIRGMYIHRALHTYINQSPNIKRVKNSGKIKFNKHFCSLIKNLIHQVNVCCVCRVSIHVLDLYYNLIYSA